LQIINELKLNPRKLFLIDCLGALASAFLLGVILVLFEEFIGMPKEVLYYLAIAACVFAVYSFFCYFHFPNNWQPFMKAIVIANLLYCLTTIGLVIFFYSQLTIFGVLYFLGELGIIFGLISLELKTASE
jgi:hypothetical protein